MDSEVVFQIATFSECFLAVWESADQNLVETIRVLVTDLLYHEVLTVFITEAVVRVRGLLDAFVDRKFRLGRSLHSFGSLTKRC